MGSRTHRAVASLGSFAVRRASHLRLPMFARKWEQYIVVRSLRMFCKRPVYYGTRVHMTPTHQKKSRGTYLDKYKPYYDSDYWHESPSH